MIKVTQNLVEQKIRSFDDQKWDEAKAMYSGSRLDERRKRFEYLRSIIFTENKNPSLGQLMAADEHIFLLIAERKALQ